MAGRNAKEYECLLLCTYTSSQHSQACPQSLQVNPAIALDGRSLEADISREPALFERVKEMNKVDITLTRVQVAAPLIVGEWATIEILDMYMPHPVALP